MLQKILTVFCADRWPLRRRTSSLHGSGPLLGVVVNARPDHVAPALHSVPAPELAEQFAGLLWGDLMVNLLLRVVDTPGPEEITRRARGAATAFLRLHPTTGAAR
mgnify:CR=1 FL=1